MAENVVSIGDFTTPLRRLTINSDGSLNTAPGLPGGTIVTATGTNPAAGVEISETVPANQVWQLLAIRYTLVTDATVATRAPTILFDDGTNTIYRIAAASTQTASQTIAYNWAMSVGYEKAASSSNVSGSLPPLLLPAGYRIRTSTGAIVAGDDYGAPVLHYRRYTV